jgi:hypothetical protein
MVDKFVQRKGAVMHNGHQFVKGSLSERVYLVIGELGVATNADVAAVLTERGVAFSPRSLKTTTQRMNARGQLKKLPRCMWSWG